MEIRKDILAKYLKHAAIEQLKDDYLRKGYKNIENTFNKNYDVDLILQKDKDIIVFEIKSEGWNQKKQISIVKRRNFFVNQVGASFRIVLVKIPDQPDIVVEDIESILEIRLTEKFIDRFSEMATHHWSDEISDVYYSSIEINKDYIHVIGSGINTLGLQYGSDGDFKRGDGVRWYKSFTFNFDIVLDGSLKLIDEKNLSINDGELE